MAGKLFEKRANVANIKVPEIALPRTAGTKASTLKCHHFFYLIGNATSWHHF